MPTLIKKLFGEQDVMSIRDQAVLRGAAEEKKAAPPTTNYNAAPSTAAKQAAQTRGLTPEQLKAEQDKVKEAWLAKRELMAKQARQKAGYAEGGRVNTVQDLRDILASWEGQELPPDISQLEADLNAYDQDNDPTSFRAQSQAQREAEYRASIPQMKESDWAPAFVSHKDAALRGLNIRQGLGDIIASPLIITDAAEMALDAIRGVKSPSRFRQGSNSIAKLLGEEAYPEHRFPSEYDWTEIGANVLNPVNLVSGEALLGGLKGAAKYARKMPLKEAVIPLTLGAGAGYATAGKPKEYAGGGLARLAARLGKDSAPIRRGVSDVIKEKGGNWLSGSVEGALGGLRSRAATTPEDAAAVLGGPGYVTPEVLKAMSKNRAINNWIDKPLTRYVKNEMATPQDPIRALAERGVLHYAPESMPRRMDASKGVWDKREMAGFPASKGTSTLAQRWEAYADDALQSRPMSDYQDFGPSNLGQEWVNKLQPDTPMYLPESRMSEALSRGDDISGLGFNHLIDELSNAINPESGLPRELLFPADRLDKVTVPQAVERVAKINEWRVQQAKLANIAAAEGIPVRKVHEGGYKWLDVPDTADEKARKFAVDCGLAGGWCTQSPKTAQDYGSGRGGRLHILTDPEGSAQVQIHTTIDRPYSPRPYQQAIGLTDSDMAGLEAEWAAMPRGSGGFFDFLHAKYPDVAETRITQIKGKHNKAPNPEYLPMVQDFVKSGQWSDVGDLRNTGLRRSRDLFNEVEANALKEQGHDFGEYMTPEEVSQLHEVWNIYPKPTKNFARGGSVKKITTVQDLQDIINAL